MKKLEVRMPKREDGNKPEAFLLRFNETCNRPESKSFPVRRLSPQKY